MAGSRGRYPPEYKEQIVELVRSGRSPGSLAREFEPSEQTIRNWVKQADLDEGRRSDGLQDVGIQGVTRRRFKTARLPSVVQPGPSMAHRPAYRKCFRRGPTMTKLLNHRQPHSEVDLRVPSRDDHVHVHSLILESGPVIHSSTPLQP